MSTTSASKTPTRVSHCSCGRPAREVLPGGEHGPTGYCGVPGMAPLDPCDCGHGAEQHDRSVCHVYGTGQDSQTCSTDPAVEDVLAGLSDEEHPAIAALERLTPTGQAMVLHYVIGAASNQWAGEFLDLVEYAARSEHEYEQREAQRRERGAASG